MNFGVPRLLDGASESSGLGKAKREPHRDYRRGQDGNK